MDPREVSFRQAFRAPDQESDDYEEDDSEDEDEDEDEDASDSSSEESSIANEPPVALPSANIQDQVPYPAVILSEASPGRLYTVWPSGMFRDILTSARVNSFVYRQWPIGQG